MLTNHFKSRFHLLLINTILKSYQMSPFLLFQLLIEFCVETHTCSPHQLFEKADDNISNPLSPFPLYKLLVTTYYFFFIQYIPEVTTKPCWFLVQVNHIKIEISKTDVLCTG